MIGCEPLPAAGARGLFTDRLGDLREVQTQRQAGHGAELGRREGGHPVARGVMKPRHGSRLRGRKEGGRHRSKSILVTRRVPLSATLEDAFVKRHVRSRVFLLAEGSLQTPTVASLGETTEIGEIEFLVSCALSAPQRFLRTQRFERALDQSVHHISQVFVTLGFLEAQRDVPVQKSETIALFGGEYSCFNSPSPL